MANWPVTDDHMLKNAARLNRRRFFTGCAGVGLASVPAVRSSNAQNGDGRQPVAQPIDGVVSVRSFGAKGDRTTDDTLAIRKAIETSAAGGGLYFPPGTYRISEEIQAVSNLRIVGDGATIVCDDVVRSYFYFSNVRNVSVRGLTFDMNQPNLPVYALDRIPQNVALFFDAGAADIVVADNFFVNLYTNAVRFYQSSGRMSVVGNSFSSPVQKQMVLLEHLFFLTVNGRLNVRDNRFANAAVDAPASVPAGMFISGTRGTANIEGNSFDYCGRDNTGHHRVGVIDFYDNSENVTVANNTSTNTMAVFLRLESAWPAKVFGNVVSRSARAEPGGNTMVIGGTVAHAGTEAKIGVTNVEVFGNVLTCAVEADAQGIGLIAYDYSVPSTMVRLHHNTFIGLRCCIGVIGPFDDLAIESNSLRGPGDGAYIQIRDEGGHVEVTSRNGTTRESAIYRGLRIRDNAFSSPFRGSQPINVDFSRVPESSTIGDIVVSDNLIEAIGEVAGVAIAARSNGTRGTISIRGNVVRNFASSVQAEGFSKQIVIE